MSQLDEYADPEVYMPELEESCDYGCEFCTDPETKRMGLCTTECNDYIAACEEMSQEEKRKALNLALSWPAKEEST